MWADSADGRPRRAWVPVAVIILIAVLAIAGALALRARWLSGQPRTFHPSAAEPDARR